MSRGSKLAQDDWRGKRLSRNQKRLKLRRELVHAAGCCWTEHGNRCMVRERFNYDEEWLRTASDLGVRIPRSLRGIYTKGK